MKRVIIVFFLVTVALTMDIRAQLTIEACQEKARDNYPLIRRYNLIRQSGEYTLSNAGKGYLPQLSLSAKATWQSEVTHLPVSLPGVNIKELSKDQYQAVIELSQSVWDGGRIHTQKQMAKAGTQVETEQLNVDMYAVRDRVNQLFFGILLVEAQLKQNELFQQELGRNYDQVKAYVMNGIANEADLDAVRVEQVRAIQQQTEMLAMHQAYGEMLGYMIGTPLQLTGKGRWGIERPVLDRGNTAYEIRRPELQFFDARNKLLEAQRRILTAGNMPVIGLFAQGGYSNPGLNMLKNEFSPWFIGGLRLSWNFGSLYTKKNDKRQIMVDEEGLAVEKETFLFNTNLQITQENNEIAKIRGLMKHDDEIISLRDRIKKTDETKVANGILSVTELLREINAGEQARQSKLLHEIQLLKNIYDLKNTTNN